MKIAFIGSYGHQGYIMADLTELGDCTVVGLARSEAGEDIERLLEPLKEKGQHNVQIYDDYRRMLDEQQPDVVGVSPMYCHHKAISVECLQRGVSVMCEKPVAFSLAELEQLQQVYAQGEAHFVGMHGMRYQPEFYAACQAVKEGRIGRPVLITSQKSYAFDNTRPQFYRQRQTYGGTLCWVAIHALDWTHWIMGDVEQVFAAHTTIANRGYDECESSGVIAFDFKDGGQGCVNFDFLKAYSDVEAQDRVRIAGESGVIEVRNKQAHIVTHEQPQQPLPLGRGGGFFKEFANQIKGTGRCRISAEDTFAVTRLALLARQSADTRALVQVG